MIWHLSLKVIGDRECDKMTPGIARRGMTWQGMG